MLSDSLAIHFPSADALFAESLNKAAELVRRENYRLYGFVTNGILSKEGGTAHDTVDLLDALTGRALPFVVFTTVPDLFSWDSFRRLPVAIVPKSRLESFTECVLPFRSHLPLRRHLGS